MKLKPNQCKHSYRLNQWHVKIPLSPCHLHGNQPSFFMNISISTLCPFFVQSSIKFHQGVYEELRLREMQTECITEIYKCNYLPLMYMESNQISSCTSPHGVLPLYKAASNSIKWSRRSCAYKKCGQSVLMKSISAIISL